VEPQTVWEREDQVASGSRVAVRAAAFSIASTRRGGVTLTTRVPSEFGELLPDGSVTVTLLLDPSEATGLAELLREASAQAAKAGPGIFSEDVEPSPG
jgi:hypothetical protein